MGVALALDGAEEVFGLLALLPSRSNLCLRQHDVEDINSIAVGLEKRVELIEVSGRLVEVTLLDGEVSKDFEGDDDVILAVDLSGEVKGPVVSIGCPS